MTRFAFLIGSPKIGGAEAQARALARGAIAHGHDASVCFLERRGRRPAAARLDFGDLPHIHLGHGRARGWYSRGRLLRFVRREGVDCVVAFNVDAMEFAVAALGSVPGLALVGSVRGLGFDGDPELVRRLRRCAERMGLLTCNTIAIQRALVANGICAEAAVRRLPNIVELAPEAPPRNGPVPTVLFVGNLIEVKRPELFVQACRIAMRSVPGLRAVVVGDGPRSAAMRAAAGEDLGRFEFRGHRAPDAIGYAGADLVVSTSRREGSSNVLLEALAHGRPVVAARAGGNEDLVLSSQAGILVDSDQPGDFAAAIVRLVASIDERRSLGAAGRRFIEQQHGVDQVIAMLEQFAAEALERSRRG